MSLSAIGKSALSIISTRLFKIIILFIIIFVIFFIVCLVVGVNFNFHG